MSISDKMAAFAVARVAYISKLKNPTEQQTMFAELWRKRESGAELTAAETRALKTLLAAENSLLSLQQSRSNTEATLRNLLNLRPGQAMAVQPESFRLPEGGKLDLNVPISTLAARPDLIALVRLCQYLARLGIDTLDTQFLTPHLISMGGIHIPRRDYLARLTDNPDAHRGRWQWQETG